MLEAGSPLYVLFAPDGSGEAPEPTLHPGRVLGCDGETFVAEFAEAVGMEVMSEGEAFAEVRGKFFRQPVAVVAVGSGEASAPGGASAQGEAAGRGGAAFTFRRVGPPESAEKREAYRVSTATVDVRLELRCRAGNETCRVVDVSPEGCAVVAAPGLAVGDVVGVALKLPPESAGGPVFPCGRGDATGAARVQTVKALPGGLHRYGLLAVDGKGQLRRAFEQMTAGVQRLHLRRLARSA